jgi:steroid 5-alpha reductase family enzyme
MPLDSSDQAQASARTTRTLAIGGLVIVVLAAGWFALSWRVGHSSPADAFGEALGVAFALLIVFSVIGAVRGRDRPGTDDRAR